jgi:hypothetical protein
LKPVTEESGDPSVRIRFLFNEAVFVSDRLDQRRLSFGPGALAQMTPTKANVEDLRISILLTQASLLILLISAFVALLLHGKFNLKGAQPSVELSKKNRLALIDRL